MSYYQRGGDGAHQVQIGRRDEAPIGCFLLAWLFFLILALAFWGLVGYGIWEAIQYLQRH